MQFDREKVAGLTTIGNEAILDAAQSAMIRELAELVAPRIGLDPIPCRGAWLSAVRRYQSAHAKAAADVSKAGPPDRVKAAREIRAHFRAIVVDILREPGRQGELDAALDEGFALYMAKYNRR